jgi:hypothetical protein
MTIPQLPPLSRIYRVGRARPIPVDPADLRTFHQLLGGNIALGLLNLALTLLR